MAECEGRETILVIDDETAIRTVLADCLASEGLGVITAADGREGVRTFQERRPSIVLTDFSMPGMDGMAVLRAIHREDPEAKVVVMTGHGDTTLAIEALRAGASNYINKPIRLEELYFIIRAHERMVQAQRRERFPFHTLVEERRTLRLTNDQREIYPAVCSSINSLRPHLLPDEANSIAMALSEALINAIEHGNLGIGYGEKSQALEEGRYEGLLGERLADPSRASRRVTFESHVTRKSARFRVADEGEGFDWRGRPDPSDANNLLRVSGRGLSIIELFMDEVGFNDKGNEIWMRADLAKRAARETAPVS